MDRAKTQRGRNELAVDCSASAKEQLTKEVREQLAAVMRVRPSRVPWIFCDRVITALARGDLPKEAFTDMLDGSPSSPATITRVLEALAKPGSTERQAGVPPR